MKKTLYMKQICFGLLLTGLLLASNSCTKDFIKNNTDPTKATEEQLKYDNYDVGGFISQMENEIIPILRNANNTDLNKFQLIYSLAGDVYSGQQGASNAFNNNGVNNTTYAMIAGWYGEAYSNAYLNAMSPWYNIKLKSETSSPSTYALATILKVMAMHRVTDMYGPLPYLQFKTGAIGTPYDSQEAIYDSFFKELDASVILLNDFVKNNPGKTPLAKFDLVYGGDFTKWIKFANTLRLRLAIRISVVNPNRAKTEAEAAIAGGVMTANDDNAIIKVDGVNTQNQLYGVCYTYNDTRMGATMESFLKGYKDPRADLLFKKVALPAGSTADFHGIRNGSIFPGHNYQVFSPLNVQLNTPVQWMTAAEAYFLRAEGALRNWNMGGTAQNLYETGIQTAFSQNIGGDNAAAGSAAAYIADGTSLPAPYIDPVTGSNSVRNANDGLSTITIKWNSADNFNRNLERIITQKWIALYPDGQEAWSEFRRTGCPKIFPVPAGNNRSNGLVNTQLQIRRLPFPQSEYLTNGTVVAGGITLLGGPDNAGTPLWWDKR